MDEFLVHVEKLVAENEKKSNKYNKISSKPLRGKCIYFFALQS